jgi:hypothetical protein
VLYTGLQEIENRAEGNADERRQRAVVAAELIREGADQWSRRS